MRDLLLADLDAVSARATEPTVEDVAEFDSPDLGAEDSGADVDELRVVRVMVFEAPQGDKGRDAVSQVTIARTTYTLSVSTALDLLRTAVATTPASDRAATPAAPDQGSESSIAERLADAISEALAQPVVERISAQTEFWQATSQQALSTFAESLEGAGEDFHRLVLGEPVKMIGQAVNVPAVPLTGIVDVAQRLPLPIDVPIRKISLVVKVTGVVVGIATGTPVLSCACAKSLARDVVSTLASRALKNVLFSKREPDVTHAAPVTLRRGPDIDRLRRDIQYAARTREHYARTLGELRQQAGQLTQASRADRILASRLHQASMSVTQARSPATVNRAIDAGRQQILVLARRDLARTDDEARRRGIKVSGGPAADMSLEELIGRRAAVQARIDGQRRQPLAPEQPRQAAPDRSDRGIPHPGEGIPPPGGYFGR
jgi:hypothetical protein